MSDIYITIAVEDLLSEVIVKRILEQVDKGFVVRACLGKKGNGYLRANISKFNNAAKNIPFLVLTDQDTALNCPPSIIGDWLSYGISSNMIFRVATMEVESWVLAHRYAFSDFLGISVNRIPNDVDTIENPKEFLINLVRKCRNKKLRDDLIPGVGSTASIGPDYNNRLSLFINDAWDVKEAINHSNSLRRTFKRINDFHIKDEDAGGIKF